MHIDSTSLDAASRTYHEYRRQLMLKNQQGLTATYNRFHNAHDQSADIVELRRLHVAMDLAVRDAYGWQDLDLQHGFYDTPQGERFTFPENVRKEVLDRLLELNHQRYAEEVARGLHAPKKADAPKPKTRAKKSRTDGQGELTL